MSPLFVYKKLRFVLELTAPQSSVLVPRPSPL